MNNNKPAIDVDVAGTLFLLDEDTALFERPNKGLITALLEANDAGHPVRFHTGGNKIAETRALMTRLPEGDRLITFPLTSKHDKNGQIIDVGIDDETPERLRMTYGFTIRQHIPSVEHYTPFEEPNYYRQQLTQAFTALAASPSANESVIAQPSAQQRRRLFGLS